MSTILSHVQASHTLKSDDFAVQTIEVVHEDPINDLETRVPSTIDGLIKLRAQQSGKDDPIVAYPNEGTNYQNYSPRDLDDLVERAAAHYASLVPQRVHSNDPVHVVGILGNSDLDYLVTFLAVSRLGHSGLLLSTRITGEAYESLLSTTKATVLLHHPEFTPSANEVSQALPSLRIGVIPVASSLPSVPLRSSSLDLSREASNICWIIHSSGSTGLPKPIYQTHKAALYTYSQNFGLVGHITLPLFHNHGICCLFRAIHSKRKIYIYNARLPLASKHLVATLEEHPDIRILYGVPYALKLLSESARGVELLSRLEIVMFGGSACPKPIGDSLVDNGVNLVGHYGATEVGQLMTSFRDHRSDKGWDWLRVPTHLKPFLSMEPRGPNLFELCVMDGWGSKVATNRDDGSYATKDLFEPHPTMPDAWKYYARLDDTIVLENGEKANPLLVEGVIRQNPHVAEVVVFGASKPRLGAFIIPATTSDLSDTDVLAAVLPALVAMNKAVPAYSQMSKEMIKILPRDAEYRRTDKGTVIRAAFYRDYAKQIDAAYVDQQSGSLVLPKNELLDFLRKDMLSRVRLPAGASLSDSTDLFSLGVDSLQAIQVRSFVLQNLRVGGQKLGRNFVFDFPTLEKMADEILRLQAGAPEREVESVESRMAAMIEKYAHFAKHTPVENATTGKYIIVTGATGSLGAHVAAKLASQHSVKRVYCLVRASSQTAARQRVRQSLRERLVYHKLSLSARSKIIALPSNFGDADLGLQKGEYEEISAKITHVLHLAWSVNFNKGLESFEADCIAGARNLINLCLAAKRPQPAAFNFCSSVSATVATPGDVVPEALPKSLSYAQGMGYAQSKLVTEHLCDRAAQQTGMTARVLRVGQVIGDTQNGMWNETEAIPMLFQTATTIGALPELDEHPAWLPVDLVADTCAEIACSGAASGVSNIVNPATFHFTRDLLPLLRDAGLQFDSVPQREWIRRLRESNPDPKQNPPIKLVDFFASKYDNDKPRKSGKHATEHAQSHSPSLQNARVIDAALMRKIVAQLQRKWSQAGTSEADSPAVVVVGGPCGSGKSTVAQSLAQKLRLPVIEGDEMHTIAAREKMSRHVPLDDADRLAWLAHIRGAVMDRQRTSQAAAVLVTCSALKGAYRDEIRLLRDIAGFKSLFLMLETSGGAELRARMAKREGHYMDPVMVDSQIGALELAREDEFDVVPVDATRGVDEVCGECREILEELLF